MQSSFVGNPDSKKAISCMVCWGLGVWLATQGGSRVYLYHALTHEQLLDVSIAQAVAQKLQSKPLNYVVM